MQRKKLTNQDVVVDMGALAPVLLQPPRIKPRPTFDQAALLKKMNVYLRRVGRPAISEEGYCHGLVLRWLNKMGQHNVESFYRSIEKIIICPDDELTNIGPFICDFLVRMDLGQFPSRWLPHLSQYNVDLLLGIELTLTSKQIHFAEFSVMLEMYNQQLDLYYEWGVVNDFLQKIDVKLGMEKQDSFSEFYTTQKLIDFFDAHQQPGNKIRVSSRDSLHAIGVYMIDDAYHVYDPNEITGRHKSFTHSKSAVDYMLRCLYSRVGFAVLNNMELDIKLVRDPKLQRQIQADAVFIDGLKKSFSSILSIGLGVFQPEEQDKDDDLEAQRSQAEAVEMRYLTHKKYD